MGGEVLSEIIIVGSGPAGLTAAIYSARAALRPIVLSGPLPGGQLTTTTLIENWPGHESGIDGSELVSVMKKQAESFGAEFVDDRVIALKQDSTGEPFLICESEKTYQAKAILLATGASPKLPPNLDLKNLMGRGVSTCATCDGFFFRKQAVAVMGGGDSAAEESLYLSKLGCSVTLIHRRDALRASQIMADRVKKDPNIKILWNSEVQEIKGDEKGLTHLRVWQKDQERQMEIPVHGLFIAIGHTPNVSYLKNNETVHLDDHGYIQTYEGTFTSQKGVFAAGDVEDLLYRQAITAAGRGCQAALQAERYINGFLSFPKIVS
jgi:thioredoxin reductase (NADPH)